MKKLKLLKSIISNTNKTYKTIKKHKDNISDKISNITEIKDSVKSIAINAIANNEIANKVNNKLNKIITKKQQMFWDIKNKKKEMSEGVENLIIKLPDYADLIYSLNLKNKKFDTKWRESKILSFKILTKFNIIRKISKINFQLFDSGKINERQFITNFYFTSFFETMYGNPNNVKNDLINMRNKFNDKMYKNWYLYVYGRVYFYSILKWRGKQNPLLSYIIGLNNEIYLEIKNEINEFTADTSRWNYYSIIDLTFANSLHPLLSIKRDKNEFAIRIYNILNVLIKSREHVTKEHVKLLQFILPSDNNFMDYINLLNKITSINSYFFYEFTKLKGKVIESTLNKKINDNFDYLVYGLLFSIFSEKEFFFDINRIKKTLGFLKMKDSYVVLDELGKEIKNIKTNLDYAKQ